jgi:hypothetical protein
MMAPATLKTADTITIDDMLGWMCWKMVRQVARVAQIWSGLEVSG